MSDEVFTLRMPARLRSCAVFSSPHSGSDYPPDFLAASPLTPLDLRSSEDAFVDELYAAVPGHRRPPHRRAGAAGAASTSTGRRTTSTRR